ncbi:tRNA (adenine(37)-N6)-methyltransferase [Planococcus citri]|uniref:tRNA (adenine(37)-N6)-methyltransferase n=1 Tax=Planococcus citri TaxID=170843 RepID=UPI0031F79282
MATGEREQGLDDGLTHLSNQLSIARKELQNIRKDLRRLNSCYQKDIDNVITSLKSWKCESCSASGVAESSTSTTKQEDEDNALVFQPIGLITSSFQEKRGTPRQPGICINSSGRITLFNSIFTNPSHALEGLDQFSHMWILFHFHKNDTTHVRAKVAPPRLNGLRTGVFGTRSPHRPSPVGLSLVRIDRVEGSSVYFSGVDMLDGTPVLDIKPYIPQYDNPLNLGHTCNSTDTLRDRLSVGEPLDDCVRMPREAPDGEECGSADDGAKPPAHSAFTEEQIRVPQWISEPINSQLTVTFKERANSYLDSPECTDETGSSENLRNTITRILEEDPRSVYVRERYSNQFYTFLIDDHHVSCKFDDTNHSVQVYKIVKASSVTEWKGSFDKSEHDH